MRKNLLTFKLCLILGASWTIPAAAQHAGGAPTLDLQLFRDPPASVRPLYRWWLPLAAVEEEELRREIDQMVDAGAGGVEIAAMPVPGAIGSDPEFLRDNGFGSSRWSQALSPHPYPLISDILIFVDCRPRRTLVNAGTIYALSTPHHCGCSFQGDKDAADYFHDAEQLESIASPVDQILASSRRSRTEYPPRQSSITLERARTSQRDRRAARG
jgi:hypothetical protein